MEPMGNLLPAQRQQVIIDIIRENYTARSSQLSLLLKVSEMTIRRDLAALESQGILKRTHGGAVFHHERVVDKFQYQHNEKKDRKTKKRLAGKAARLIEPNDVIFVGEGPTAALIFRYVDPELPFTVFSNNFGIAAEFDRRGLAAELIFLGGAYNPTTCSTAGNVTFEMIERINANKVILAVDGFSLRAGLTAVNHDIAAVNRAMIRRTHGTVAIMVDKSRFGLVAPIEVAAPKEIDILITDYKLPSDFTKDSKLLGISVLLAE